MFNQVLDVYQGDTCVFDFAVSQLDGVDAYFSGGKVLMFVKAAGREAVSPAVQVADGHIVAVFDHALTHDFDFPAAEYELRYVAGADVVTLARGKIRVVRQVQALADIPAAGAPRTRKIEFKLVLGSSVLVVSGGGVVVDPNIPDLIDFYMTTGAAPVKG